MAFHSWNIIDVTPPPILQKIEDANLVERILDKDFSLPKIPHHSINNEKHVQEVCKTLKTAAHNDHDKRLGTLVVNDELRLVR